MNRIAVMILALVSVMAMAGWAEDLRSDPVMGSTILLRAATLEPTRSPVTVPEGWRGTPGDDYDYRLILLPAPATKAHRAALRDRGIDLIDYIPYNAYIAKVPAQARQALESAPVRWSSIWHPWFKLSPELRDKSGSVELNIVLHPFEAPEALRAWLAERGMQSAPMLMAPDQWVVRATLSASRLADVAARREVQWIEENLPIQLYNSNAQWVTQSFVSNTRPVWDAGLTGIDQIIEVNDSGCRTTHYAFVDPEVPITTWGDYPTHRKILAYLDGTPMGQGNFGDEYDPYPPYGHGTHVSCSVAGDDGDWTLKDGMAKGAKLVITDIGTESGLYSNMPYQMFFSAHQRGATIHNCSWGQDTEGAYNTYDSSVDSYMWYFPYDVASIAAGNNPPNTVCGSPGNAKSILCVGASKNGTTGNQLATWSARGPTADGRYAPTFLTPGENVSSASNAADGGYANASGTSMASPISAGCAALVRSYYMNGYYPTGTATPANGFVPLNSLVKATMIASTRDVTSYQPPSNRTGWGFVVLDDALYFGGRSRTMWVYQDTTGMAEGESDTWQITASAGGELKIVVCWSDKQGSTTGSGPRMKNDLDLEVQAPGGATYLGNVFSAGQSVTGGSADRLNTTEVVWLRSPAAGTYTITVTYYASVQDDIQRFSIVAVGEGVGPAGGDTEPPTTPANVHMGTDGTLSWSPSTDNIGVWIYNVYRGTDAYFAIPGLMPYGNTATTSIALPECVGDPAVNYYFRVTAMDTALNESAPSAPVGEHDYQLDDGR